MRPLTASPRRCWSQSRTARAEIASLTAKLQVAARGISIGAVATYAAASHTRSVHTLRYEAPAEGALAKVESPASGPPPDPSDAMLRGAGSLVSELPLHINGSKGKFEGDESGLSDGAEDLDAEIEAFRAKLAVTPLPPKSGRFSPANRVGLRGKG